MSRRVESGVGNAEFAWFMIDAISVHARASASQRR